MLAFTSIALALVTTAAAQGTSTITTLGSTVTVSIITYRSFNIDPYKTTTYVSLIGSNANTTTFAIDRECFTGIEAFPTFPICGHHVESPKFLTVGPTHLAMTTIAPVTSANDYSSSDNPTWQLTQNCRISRSDEMTCTVEQTGPSWVLSNMYASGAERSVITDTASSQEWPPPDTTEGIIPGPTGTGISSQTSTFTVSRGDMMDQYLVITAGLKDQEAKPTSGASRRNSNLYTQPFWTSCLALLAFFLSLFPFT